MFSGVKGLIYVGDGHSDWPRAGLAFQVPGAGGLEAGTIASGAPSGPAPPLFLRPGAHLHFHSCASSGFPQFSVELGRGHTIKRLVQHRLGRALGASEPLLVVLDPGPGCSGPEGPGAGGGGGGFWGRVQTGRCWAFLSSAFSPGPHLGQDGSLGAGRPGHSPLQRHFCQEQ